MKTHRLHTTAEQKALGEKAIREMAALLLEKMDPALIGFGTETGEELLSKVGSSSPRQADREDSIERWQDERIEQMIPKGASVLDLGCGCGELLERLMRSRQVRGQGIELDADEVFACVERGVPVFQADLNDGLRGLPDQSYDFVVLEETLQTLVRPDHMLSEMLRVGRHGIVTFPNFGYWRIRLDLAVRGRMPVSEWLPYGWYNSPNIHLFTLQDFLDWSDENGVELIEGHALVDGEVRPLQASDNLYAEEVLVVVRAGKEK